MKNKLIVGGCSITHGAETVNGFMHPDNVKNSYSWHLAEWLDLDLVNLALSGGSNDDIFHAVINEIDKNHPAQIHSVFVAWTGINRLHWVNKDRHWFFIPGWASSMKDLYDWEFHQHPTSQIFITGDTPEVLDQLHDQHRFLVDNYLDDHDFLSKKLTNYKSALQSHCDSRNIPLVQIDIMKYWRLSKHPTAAEHLELAKIFQRDFFKMD